MWPAAAPAALRPCASVAPAASAAAFFAAPASSTPTGSLDRSQTTPARMKTCASAPRELLVARGGDERRRPRAPSRARARGRRCRRRAAAPKRSREHDGRRRAVGRHEALGERDDARRGRRARPRRARAITSPSPREGTPGRRSRRARRRPRRGSMRSSRGQLDAGQVGAVLALARRARCACSAVRVCSVVRSPPRASSTASAVPNEPAPTTVARRGPGRAAASARGWPSGRARSRLGLVI